MLGKLAKEYFDSTMQVLTKVYDSQQSSISDAANLISEQIVKGKHLHLWDTGHTIQTELVNRAGGLMSMTPFTFDLKVVNEIAYQPIIPKDPQVSEEEIRGLVGYALAMSNIEADDVLIIGSVTGARPIVVEMAIQAKARGIKVIGLTSLNYSRWVNAKHSSGKKLYEIADIVIDNDCEIGDAIVEVEELDGKICPTTGLTAGMIMWLLSAQIVENLLAKGIKPDVFISMNLPGAMERNQRVVLKENEDGTN